MSAAFSLRLNSYPAQPAQSNSTLTPQIKVHLGGVLAGASGAQQQARSPGDSMDGATHHVVSSLAVDAELKGSSGILVEIGLWRWVLYGYVGAGGACPQPDRDTCLPTCT